MELYNEELEDWTQLLWITWVDEQDIQLIMNLLGVIFIEDWCGTCSDIEIRTFSPSETHHFIFGILPPLF